MKRRRFRADNGRLLRLLIAGFVSDGRPEHKELTEVLAHHPNLRNWLGTGELRILDAGLEMANWTENDLKRQFKRAKKNGWIKTFKSAAATYQLPPEVLMAITSRETNMRNIIGDGGHGYGLMQIDDRSFPEWCNSGLWKGPHAGIQKGALVLHSKQQTIRNGPGKSSGWQAVCWQSKPQQGRSPPNRRCSL
jgi:hypothetical protein